MCGSVGAMGRKWTYERCLELARRCSSKKEFKEMSASAYAACREKGWLSGFDWLKRSSSYCESFRGMPKAEYDGVVRRICEDFVGGNYGTRTELSERYGVTWDTIRRILEKNGIPVPKTRHDEYWFSVCKGDVMVFERIRMTDFVSWYNENVKKTRRDTMMSSIRRVLKGKRKSAYGFRFVLSDRK